MTRMPSQPPLRLRPYQQADAEVLAGWYHLAGASCRTVGIAASETVAAGGDAWFALGNHSLPEALPVLRQGNPGLQMLMLNGTPVGFLSAEMRQVPVDPVLWLRILLVDPAWRRRGIGRAAFSQLLSLPAAPIRLARRVMLAVDGENTAGYAFWRALGFEDQLVMPGTCDAARTVRILAMPVRRA